MAGHAGATRERKRRNVQPKLARIKICGGGGRQTRAHTYSNTYKASCCCRISSQADRPIDRPTDRRRRRPSPTPLQKQTGRGRTDGRAAWGRDAAVSPPAANRPTDRTDLAFKERILIDCHHSYMHVHRSIVQLWYICPPILHLRRSHFNLGHNSNRSSINDTGL